jgi:hypothetical protein
MAAKPRATAGRLIGYARVTAKEQGTDPQLNELHRPAAPPSSRSTPPPRPAAGRC